MMKLVTTFLFAFVYFAVFYEVVNYDTPYLSQKCILKTGITLEDILNIILRVVPVTRREQLYAACVAKEMGIMSDDNNVIVSKIEELSAEREKNPENLVNWMKIVKFCAESVPVEADEGLMALILLKCMIEQGEKNDIKVGSF